MAGTLEKSGTAARPLLNVTGQNLLRVLIASYFLAVAVGFVPGTDPTILFKYLLPAPHSAVLGTAVAVSLSFLILTGFALRTSVLLMSLGIFWSSYLTALELGLSEQLGYFWRDLALIAALMLTYIETEPRSTRKRQMFRTVPDVRKVPFGKRPKRIANKTVPVGTAPEPLLLTHPLGFGTDVASDQRPPETAVVALQPKFPPAPPMVLHEELRSRPASTVTATDAEQRPVLSFRSNLSDLPPDVVPTPIGNGRLSPRSFVAGPFPVERRPKPEYKVDLTKRSLTQQPAHVEKWIAEREGSLIEVDKPDLIDENDLPRRRGASISS